MVCTLFLSFHKILELLWVSHREVGKHSEDEVFMLETLWLIFENKSIVKITILLALCSSPTYFKKSGEHRGQWKSSAQCNCWLYQTETEVRCFAARCLIVFLIALQQSQDNTDTDWWNSPLSKPIHSLQINSHRFPFQLNGSLKQKWGAFQFRLLSSQAGRSFVWKLTTRLIVWFNPLLWGCITSTNTMMNKLT